MYFSGNLGPHDYPPDVQMSDLESTRTGTTYYADVSSNVRPTEHSYRGSEAATAATDMSHATTKPSAASSSHVSHVSPRSTPAAFDFVVGPGRRKSTSAATRAESTPRGNLLPDAHRNARDPPPAKPRAASMSGRSSGKGNTDRDPPPPSKDSPQKPLAAQRTIVATASSAARTRGKSAKAGSTSKPIWDPSTRSASRGVGGQLSSVTNPSPGRKPPGPK